MLFANAMVSLYDKGLSIRNQDMCLLQHLMGLFPSNHFTFMLMYRFSDTEELFSIQEEAFSILFQVTGKEH